MDKNTLKSYFLTGKKPTQGQFAELIDSFFHKDDKINISDIMNLSVLLGNKVEREDIPYLINIDGKQDKTSDMLQTEDKSVVGAINELEARKVNLYKERMFIIAPRSEGYARILSVKSGSFVLDFEINEYPGHYYNSSEWDKSYTSRKYTDRLMVSTGRNAGNACTLRSKDFAYSRYSDSETGYTDIYVKTDNLLKTISLRLSFATNDEEDAIVYCNYPVYTPWEYIPGVPAIVDTIQNTDPVVLNLENALRISVDETDTEAGYKELDNLVDYTDFIIDLHTWLPEGFYFNAANVEDAYYSETSMYRFSFSETMAGFTVKAGEEILFTYPGIISRNEILTAISPDTPEGEWTFSLSKPQMTSSDDSINITVENGVTDLTLNRAFAGQGGIFEITQQNVEQVVVIPDEKPDSIVRSPDVRKLLIPADTETLVLSCPIGYYTNPEGPAGNVPRSILQICADEGSFKNGQVLNILNNGADMTRISTQQSEGSGYENAEGTIVGYGGMYMDDKSFGVGRRLELVYWNGKWFTTAYNYANPSSNVPETKTLSFFAGRNTYMNSIYSIAQTGVFNYNGNSDTTGYLNPSDLGFLSIYKELNGQTHTADINADDITEDGIYRIMKATYGTVNFPAGVDVFDSVLFVNKSSENTSSQVLFTFHENNCQLFMRLNVGEEWVKIGKDFQQPIDSLQYDVSTLNESVGNLAGDKQDKYDSALETNAGSVVGAINELNSIIGNMNTGGGGGQADKAIELFPFLLCTNTDQQPANLNGVNRAVAFIFSPSKTKAINKVQYILSQGAPSNFEFALYKYTGNFTDGNIPVQYLGKTNAVSNNQYGLITATFESKITLDDDEFYYVVVRTTSGDQMPKWRTAYLSTPANTGENYSPTVLRNQNLTNISTIVQLSGFEKISGQYHVPFLRFV